MFSLYQYSETTVGVWIGSMGPLLAEGDTKYRNGKNNMLLIQATDITVVLHLC